MYNNKEAERRRAIRKELCKLRGTSGMPGVPGSRQPAACSELHTEGVPHFAHGSRVYIAGNFRQRSKTCMNIHGLSEENSVLLKLYKFNGSVFGFFVDYQ